MADVKRRTVGTRRAPEPVAAVAELMAGFRPKWALCGGWAVDAWFGRQTREHQDVDIAVFDQEALFEHLAGWQLIAHQETKPSEGADLWDGRPLVLPAHIHGRSPEDGGPLPERFDENGSRVLFPEDGFWLDICLCERLGRDWVLNRDSRVALPLAECISRSGWGLPTVTPEALVFFKATLYVGTKNHLRPIDEVDFAALLPLLPDEERAWLREAVSRGYVGEHPWMDRLAGDPA